MSFRITRRQFLIVGAGTGGALFLAACGSSKTGSAINRLLQGAAPGTPLEPSGEMRSSNGLLEVSLVAAGGMVPWGDSNRYALAYNGVVPATTLRVRPGDVLRVNFTNDLSEATNLHTHGLHVSPSGNSDNPFMMIEPGESLDYEFRIPEDHPSGTFWYHPHHHGNSAAQLFGGLAGTIIVEDAIDDLPELKAANQRILVLSDPLVGDDASVLDATTAEKQQGREGDVLLVNGQFQPMLSASTGTVEYWRIVNASPSRYYRLSVDGPPMFLVGTDQGRLPAPVEIADILLTPGQRAEVMVPLQNAGHLALVTTAVNRSSMDHSGGGMGNMSGMGGGSSSSTVDGERSTLLTVDVTSSQLPLQSMPTTLRTTQPKTGPIVARRPVNFGAMAMGDGEFVIDGKSFNADRIDSRATVGTTEEWTIINNSMMDHPFHLHVWPFQVVRRSTGDPDPGWRDTVNVPMGESVTIRIPFDNVTGTSVYHCHILDHEDLGMMATLLVE